MKFVCKACGYRFESESKKDGEKCPYCDRKAIIKEPNAEELLREE